MLLVRGLELFHEPAKELGALGLAGGGVVIDEIAAAAAEDFADGRRCEVARLGRDIVGLKKREDLFAIAEDAAVEGVDEEGQVVHEAADDEVAGKTDGLELQADALSDEEVHDAERERDPRAALEDLVDEAIARVGVVLDVAVEAPLVEEHAVEDAALFAGAGGLDDELATALGNGIELLHDGRRLETWRNGAGEEERAGLEFVIQRSDEAAELGHRIGELQLLQEKLRVAGQDAIGATSDGLEEGRGSGPELEEASEKGSPYGGARVVQKIQKRFTFARAQSVDIHGISGKTLSPMAQ